MIKAILFDVDGVLLDSFDSNLEFLNSFFIKTGYKPLIREQYKSFFYLPLRDTIIKVTGLKNKNEIDKLVNFAKDKNNNFRSRDPLLTKNALTIIKSLSKK